MAFEHIILVPKLVNEYDQSLVSPSSVVLLNRLCLKSKSFQVRTTCSSNGYHYVDPTVIGGPVNYNSYGRDYAPPDLVAQNAQQQQQQQLQQRSPCYGDTKTPIS